MKVLMTTMEYDVIKVGGLSAALTSISKAMKKLADPRIILPRSGSNVPWTKIGSRRYPNVAMDVFEHDGVTVYILSNDVLDEAEIYPEPAGVKAMRKIDEFGERLVDVVGDIDFDIVHVHDFFAYKAIDRFKEMGKPVLLTIHRLHREHASWFSAEEVALEKADHITVVGESYYREDERDLFAQYEGKTTVVPNGIDTEFWSTERSSYPQIPRQERRKLVLSKYGLTDGVFYLSVGRFDPAQKGIDILLRASEKFLEENDARMIIVGVGDRDLENQSKELETKSPSKARVINSLLSPEEVRDLYSGADFAVVPSVFEPFGLVQLEAMACGCIPIGSRTGGIKDTVTSYDEDEANATGLLVEKGKVDAVLHGMTRMMRLYKSDPKMIARMRKKGEERCKKVYRWDLSCRGYAEVYRKLLEAG